MEGVQKIPTLICKKVAKNQLIALASPKLAPIWRLTGENPSKSTDPLWRNSGQKHKIWRL